MCSLFPLFQGTLGSPSFAPALWGILWPFEDENCALGKPAHILPSPTSSSNKEAAADPIHSG